jgi:hypothetical protein
MRYALAVLLVVGCSIDHRSETIECFSSDECPSGRVCRENRCVTESGPDGGPKKDAGGLDAFVCPPQCTSCKEGHICLIQCGSSNNNCAGTVVCPPGFDCEVNCGPNNSCRNGVNCQQAESCNVTCSGTQACRGIQCGPGRCNVSCSGTDSCRTVQCGPSCGCDVKCSDAALCEGVFCTSAQCAVFGGGCSSSFPTCNVCP